MNTLAKASALRLKRVRQGRENDMLDAVLKLVPDAVISVDLAGRIKTFNPAAERIFGRSSDSVQGEPIGLLMPERFRFGHQVAMQRFARADGGARMMGLRRIKGLRADGQEIELEGIISHVSLPQGERSLVTLHDVTARAQSEVQLQHSRARLAELTRKLMTQERVLVKRLAQVLHDQLGQTLAAIRMCHETIMSLQTAETPPDNQRLQERLSTLIEQAILQVRQVLQDLRPPLLEEQGLSVALDNELRNRAQGAPQMDISINVPHKLELMRWPAELNTPLSWWCARRLKTPCAIRVPVPLRWTCQATPCCCISPCPTTASGFPRGLVWGAGIWAFWACRSVPRRSVPA